MYDSFGIWVLEYMHLTPKSTFLKEKGLKIQDL